MSDNNIMEGIKTKKKQLFWAEILFAALFVVFILVLFFDRQHMLKVIMEAKWGWLPLAALATLISIIFATLAFNIVCHALNFRLSKKRIFAVGLITSAVNNLISTGGAVGYSVRVLLLKNDDVSAKMIISASLLHSYFTLLVSIFFLPISFFILTDAHAFSPEGKMLLTAAAVFLAALFIFVSVVFFHGSWRHRLSRLFLPLLRRFVKSDLEDFIQRQNEVIDESLLIIREKKGSLVLLLVTAFLDWFFCLLTLWICFVALGIKLPFTFLIAGFVISIVAGLLSVIPAGMGVQDGSMAGIYTLLGVPFGEAVFATFLFRLFYYILPFGPGMIFYWFLLKREKKKHLSLEGGDNSKLE